MNQAETILIQQAVFNFNNNNYDRAFSLLSKVLKLNSRNYDALQMAGIVLGLQNDHEQALIYLNKALKINPNNFYLQFNLGKAYSEIGNEVQAIKHYEFASKLNKLSPDLFLNIGKSYAKISKFSLAIEYFDQSLILKRDFVEALFNKASAYYALQQFDLSLDLFNELISLSPFFPDGFIGKGRVLNSINNPEDALICFDKALSLNQYLYEALLHKANSYFLLNKFEDALINFNYALSINPNYSEALLLKGDLLIELNDFTNALNCYSAAININPDLDFSVGSFLYLKMKLCDWSFVEDYLTLCKKGINLNKPIIQPFALLSLTDDPQLQQACSNIYSNALLSKNLVSVNVNNLSESSRIKVAYISPDFNNHAVSLLSAELFESHNKSNFEIYGFYFGNNNSDSLFHRISLAFKNNFFDVSHLSNVDLLNFIKSFDIDIAIDLAGYTQNSRPFLFSNRCAPIQVNFLGYPGSMGDTFMDYIVADRTVIPENILNYYSEKPIYLPCFQPNDSSRKIPCGTGSREDFGLPSDVFIFCCFNNSHKLNPKMFDLWSQILVLVPNSILWLYADSEIIKSNLIQEMNLRNIPEFRLFFAKKVSYDDYLLRYQFADLFLDTLPFNGGTTASDALLCGLPVLTQCGQSFAARMCSSLLKSLDLSELITFSELEYVNTAVSLGTNPALYQSIKNKLALNRATSDLFNGKKYVDHFEMGLKAVYDRYKAGSSPDVISI